MPSARHVAFGALLIGALVGAVDVTGHAELLRSEPAADAVLLSMPSRVRLSFSEPVDPPADAVTIIGPDGERVDGRDSQVADDDERALLVSFDGQARGTYVVRWRAISADSHPISGDFQFSVGVASDVTAAELAPLSLQTTGAIPLQAAARWLHLLGLALLAGPLAMLTLMGARSTMPAIDRGLWQCSRWGAVSLLAVSGLALVAQSAAVAGSLAEGVQRTALMSLLETRWGTLWALRTLVVAVAIAATSFAPSRMASGQPTRSWHALVLVTAAALLTLTAMNGHSAATAPVWLSLPVDWLHLTATTVWIGGLFTLTAIVIPAARRLGLDQCGRVLGSVVPRFSTTAFVSVQVLVLTGLYHLWTHVSDWNALVSTSYGRTLLVKLVLVGVMLLPAAFHLLVVKRRLVGDRPTMTAEHVRTFHRTVGVEAGVGVLVLAAVGLLTTLPPARSVEAAPAAPPATALADQPAVTLTAPAGSSVVTLALGPGRIGSNRLDARIRDASGAVVTDARVRFRIVPPAASQIAPWIVVPAHRGEGYQATAALAPEGQWTIAVEVTGSSTPTATAMFNVSVPVPD